MLIEIEREAQMHREIYIALLKSKLGYGDKQVFANKVGITTQYLSYLLNPHDRTPSLETANKIANHLDISPEDKEALVFHMMMANTRTVKKSELKKVVSGEMFETAVYELREATRAAHSATDAFDAKRKFEIATQLGSKILAASPKSASRLDFVEICSRLQHLESIQGHEANAMYYASLARSTMLDLRRADYVRDLERFDYHLVNSVRIGSVAYHNFRLFKHAVAACTEAESLPEMKRNESFWRPRINLDMAANLVHVYRFSMIDVLDLAKETKNIVNRYEGRAAHEFSFLIDRQVANGFMKHGKMKRAQQILEPYIQQTDQMSGLSPLTEAMFLRTWCDVLYGLDDKLTWRYFVNKAIAVCVNSNLTHQLEQIALTFGDDVAEMFEEFGLDIDLSNLY